MPEKPTWQDIERDRDEPINLPLDPDTALRGLLKVDPQSEPERDGDRAGDGEGARRRHSN